MVDIIIDEQYCKGCELCMHYCPKQILKKSGRRNAKGYVPPMAVDPEQCSNCRTCELICPELAITLEDKP